MEIYKINAWSGNLESDKKKTRERQSLSFGNNNNNNNKAFKSQTSWGRLELKPNRNNQGSGT